MKAVEPWTVPDVAVMVVEPAAAVVASPALLIVATPFDDEVHVAVVVRFRVVPSLSVPVALIAFAIAQMGIHLVFFLHITTGPDNTNNVLALAFGVLIVGLLVFGSLWIMANLNHNMTPMDQVMRMQR